MRRVSRIIALCLCAALLLCGCEQPEPPPTPNGTAVPAPTPTVPSQPAQFSLGYDAAASLHPITGDSQVNQELTGLVYQGLYELDNTFTPRPVLAHTASVSWDGLTWTFTLDPDAVFSDGTPLTAAHAAASLTRARTSPAYAVRLAGVTSAAAGEDGAVYVTLSAPNGNLPALLDIPIVLEQGPAEDGTVPPAPLGTGYYQYEQTGDRLYLHVNPYHPSAAALPYATIPLVPASETGERIAAFDSGAISAVTTDFFSPYALNYSGSYEVCDYPTTSLLYVGFQTADGVCRSPLVRQAFSRAFDREELVDVLLSGHGDPAALPMSPLSEEYSETHAARLKFDPDAAAQLLAEAGYTLNEADGLLYSRKTPVEVTLLVNSDNDMRQAVARQLADALGSLGVTVTVSRLPWSDFTAALAGGEFDLYLGEVRLTGDFDPSALLAGELNYGGFESEELTMDLAWWRTARGSGRTFAANTFWERFVQTAPIAPLCFKRGSLLTRWGIASNLQPTRANPYYQIENWTISG